MPLLDDSVRSQVNESFLGLEKSIRLVLFTQGVGGVPECATCATTRKLAEEVSSLSEKIFLEVRDFVGDAKLAAQMHIDKIPALAILTDEPTPPDNGIRFYGIPAGFEFITLIQGILMVSRGEHGLTSQSLERILPIRTPTHIQVFVTPTCPYCPQAVHLAHRFAMANTYIRSDMVEATEFPHLAVRYQVLGVPRTVINEVIHVEGAVSEEILRQHVLQVLDDKTMARLQKEWETRYSPPVTGDSGAAS